MSATFTMELPPVPVRESIWVPVRHTTSVFANVTEVEIFGNSSPTSVNNVNTSIYDKIASLITENIERESKEAEQNQSSQNVDEVEDNQNQSQNVEDDIHSDPPILPVEYDFPLITCASTKKCLVCGYDTMGRIEKWIELRNFIVNPDKGFMFDNRENINFITDEIEKNYGGHSGASMGFTMRHLDYISKYGIEKYEEMLRNID